MYLWRRSSVAPIVSHAGIQRAGDRTVSGGGQWSLDRQTGSAVPWLLLLVVPRLASRRHHAHLRVRRGPVLRLPAVALVRSRRLVRERVPAFLRRRHRALAEFPRDLPRTDDGNRAAHQLCDHRVRALVGAVLRGGRCGRADCQPARRPARPRRLFASLRRGGRLRLGFLRAAGAAAVGAGGEIAVGALAQAGAACRDVGGARVDRHAVAVLHVHRAADVTRDLGLCGRAVRGDLASRARRLVASAG